MFEWLERECAKVEGQSPERGADDFGFVDARAIAGRVGIFRSPFRVSDVELVGTLAHVEKRRLFGGEAWAQREGRGATDAPGADDDRAAIPVTAALAKRG